MTAEEKIMQMREQLQHVNLELETQLLEVSYAEQQVEAMEEEFAKATVAKEEAEKDLFSRADTSHFDGADEELRELEKRLATLQGQLGVERSSLQRKLYANRQTEAQLQNNEA
ncbi:hypothetical protein MFLO_14182 [Listeria floridensis FSL S10-1187]|uniref:Uncharacterized protein n=1 Tax=Listeria floridensis FSL S10-1187 TaxID=1265817 RepID=A0ABN0RBW5_9LIST|nr:hypothetical protein [Listeria floridensis]EUJ26115.1 hypothetical protein MFLO_14182 [Listeria floridensis FSL S10-1187]